MSKQQHPKSEKTLNVLIVVAHPNPIAFNHRLAAIAADTLRKNGYIVSLLDLYAMPMVQSNLITDFNHSYNTRDFDYKLEQQNAFRNDSFNDEIKKSQRLLIDADILILQFPLWWFSMPAIMKNWIEKTISFDFAYNGRERRWFSNGVFKNKKAMLSLTTSGSKKLYQDNGINGDINRILWPIHNGLLNFIGYDVLPPFICWGSDTSQKNNKAHFERMFIKRLKSLKNIEPLTFHPLDKFEDGYILKDPTANVYPTPFNMEE